MLLLSWWLRTMDRGFLVHAWGLEFRCPESTWKLSRHWSHLQSLSSTGKDRIPKASCTARLPQAEKHLVNQETQQIQWLKKTPGINLRPPMSCTHTHTWTHKHMYIHTLVHAYTCTHIHTCMRTHFYTHTQMQTGHVHVHGNFFLNLTSSWNYFLKLKHSLLEGRREENHWIQEIKKT